MSGELKGYVAFVIQNGQPAGVCQVVADRGSVLGCRFPNPPGAKFNITRLISIDDTAEWLFFETPAQLQAFQEKIAADQAAAQQAALPPAPPADPIPGDKPLDPKDPDVH